ncbi:MAG TPA: hypothetical protein VFU43_30410 [Streptosporangiaceae bacterium]|nr:hypothetical protein [Streptosporangiaceae bacterium]
MLVADLPDSFGEFFLGPVWVADEVEILIFSSVEVGELLLDVVAAFVVGRCVVRHGVVDGLGDAGAYVGGNRDGRVIAFDGIFDSGDRQVRQVTHVVLTSTTDEIEVLVAAFAGAGHEDEAALAATAPRGAFEVVVVCPFAGVTRPVTQDFLDSVEEFLGDDGFVAALMFGAFVGDVAEVVAVAEHLPDFVDRDVGSCRMAFGGLHS